MNRDVYQEVTDHITAALEAGVVPWHTPWDTEVGMPRSLDGRLYRGINALLLGMSEYSDPRWGTFNAVKRYGGAVRKGEQSTLVVLWKPTEVKDPEAPTGKRPILLLRYFNVFNVAQCEELELDELPAFNPIDSAEHVFTRYPDPPSLSYGGEAAFYAPATDHVQMPMPATFERPERFYTTLFHELVHSTGHRDRLKRDDFVKSNGYGSTPYSREELTAEIGSAMLAALVGVEPDYHQSAAYIASWLAALRDDKKLIVSAAARAQKAVDLITNEKGEES